MERLIFGCGYLGTRVAKRWLEAGDTVFAVTRSTGRTAELERTGVVPLVADIHDHSALANLPTVDTVLYAVGFDRSGSQSIRNVFVDALGNVLSNVSWGKSSRFIYISSTGVYGQEDGQWVDEESPCQPVREGGLACLDAENLLEREGVLLPDGPAFEKCRLRLAGIYGPGRIPRRQEVRAGKLIAASPQGWLNLIHVDDAARVVVAAADASEFPDLLLVADGCPLRREDYFKELCRQLDAPPVCFEDPGGDSGRSQRALSSKRVSNQKMLASLGLSLEFPSFSQGLEAILAEGDERTGAEGC
jgi:nucleoside-diphosphate-sugar epimerase